MKPVAFHPDAEAEFLAAARYYEAQAENLGLDFISAVERTYRRLEAFPVAHLHRRPGYWRGRT